MNQRTRELWYKAAESTAAYTSNPNNSWETQVNFMDKFAELIVEECANLTCWQKYDMSAEQRIRLEIYQNIKQHFEAKHA